MNPFIYGEYVKGYSFINREKEIKDLCRDLSDAQKIFLISPRRYGKTSLLLRVKDELENKNVKVAYVDLFKCSSIEQMAAELAKEFSRFESITFEKTFRFIKNIISTLRPIIAINKEGEVSVQIDAIPKKQEAYNVLEELLEYAQKFAKNHKKKVVVIFDEFQEALRYDNNIENFMRALVQTHSQVGYVFCGSKKNILEEMVLKKSRAFFGIGPVVFLDKIDIEVWRSYISGVFKKHGFKIEDKVIGAILQRANGIPYYIQYLAHEIYDISSKDKKLTQDIVEETIKMIIKRNVPSYETLWQNLTGAQQRMLEGIARNDIENIFSNEFLVRHQLGTRPGAEKIVKLLIKKDILEKEQNTHVISDIWFCEWIKQYIK